MVAMFCSKNFMFRIYLSSCRCLACRNCVPALARDGKCSLCKAKNVTFKPLGNGISSEEKNLFRSVSDQPSIGMMLNMMKFKSKHVNRALEVNNFRSKSNKVKGQSKLENYKSEEAELTKLELHLTEMKRRNAKEEAELQVAAERLAEMKAEAESEAGTETETEEPMEGTIDQSESVTSSFIDI